MSQKPQEINHLGLFSCLNRFQFDPSDSELME
jgi:hypothetical protein